jgi:hypothetical protein
MSKDIKPYSQTLYYRDSIELDITYYFKVAKQISNTTRYEVIALSDQPDLLDSIEASKNIDDCVYILVEKTIQKMCERGQINLL